MSEARIDMMAQLAEARRKHESRQKERDELFQLMIGRTTTKAVERILAAGYRRPRTITTVEELNELPAETIVRDANGFTWDKWWDEDGNEYSWWATTGDRAQYSPKRVILPATVLHVGGAE